MNVRQRREERAHHIGVGVDSLDRSDDDHAALLHSLRASVSVEVGCRVAGIDSVARAGSSALPDWTVIMFTALFDDG